MPCLVASLMTINVTSELPGPAERPGQGLVCGGCKYKDGSERYVPPHAARSSDTFLWEQVSHARDSYTFSADGHRVENNVLYGHQLRGHSNTFNLLKTWRWSST